jgi:hypothetical protein
VTLRAHYRALVQDGLGNLLPESTVRVLQPGTTTLIADPIYPDNDTVSSMTNPFITEDGVINIYVGTSQRVDLGITAPGNSEVIYADVDIDLNAATSIDQTHAGLGTDSTAVGASSSSAGSGAVTFGNSASAAGDEATSAGHGAAATGNNSVAVGSGATASVLDTLAVGTGSDSSASAATAVGTESAASATNASALGASALATSTRATALGSSSSAAHAHATALGSEAGTTEANQIRLGTTTDYVDVPNFATMKSPNGVKYRFFVRDDGVLATRYHYPLGAVNLLTTGSHDDDFEGSNGSWAGTTAALANSATFAFEGSTSMRVTQSGAGPSYGQSLKVAAVAGDTYVGKAWTFRHAADGSATTLEAWLLFYDVSVALIGSAYAGPIRTIVDDIWQTVDVRAVAPALTVTVALRVGVPTGGASTDKFYVDSAGIFDVPVTT